jgi:hypothetical protein
MNSAIECNNIGVALFQTGRISEAVDTLRTAAQLMTDVSHMLQAAGSPLALYLSGKVTPMVHPSQILRGISVLRRAKDVLSQLPSEEATLHTSGKLGDREEDCFSSLSPVILALYPYQPHSCTYESSAILFNMALADQTQRSKTNLLHAISLYEMAYGLASMVPEDYRSSIVAMASLNNLGFVHYSIGNYNLSRQTLDFLVRFIALLPQTTDEGTRQERLQYLMNAEYLREPMIAGAA